MRNAIIMAAALSVSLFAFAGCKSPEEKACANLMELGEENDSDQMGDEEECVEQMKEIKEECGDNGDAVLECLADMEGDSEEKLGEEFMKCLSKCK